jgi:hypothetical protein
MSDPLRPFGDPRPILHTHLSALAAGDIAGARAVSLTYRISGGPPGKRLLELLQVSGSGEATYHHEDQLARGRPVNTRVLLPQEDVVGLFRQVHVSGLLDHRDTGNGFLPDSMIGSITLEAPDARLTYYFLADDTQRTAQRKELAEPLRALKPLLETLSQRIRNARPRRSQRKGG